MPYRDPNEYGFTDVFSHPEAENAYDLSGVGYHVTDDMGIGEGAYDPSLDKIYLGQGASKDSARSTMIHELQHGIQEREGFAGGGNVNIPLADSAIAYLPEWHGRKEVRELMDDGMTKQEIIDLYDGLPEQADVGKYFDELASGGDLEDFDLNRIDLVISDLTKKSDAERYYRSLAGEAESRNVETRKDWTMDQRRQTPPWASLDVPEDELIYTTR